MSTEIIFEVVIVNHFYEQKSAQKNSVISSREAPPSQPYRSPHALKKEVISFKRLLRILFTY